MSNFLNGISNSLNVGATANGGKAYKSTGDDLLDAFTSFGNMRESQDSEVENKFMKAMAEDKLLATKLAFYTRNVRGLGLGERKVFRTILKWLGNNYPEVVEKNLENVAHFGRFDDLFVLFGTKAERHLNQFILKSFKEDSGAEFPTLAMKWYPSANTSSVKTRALAKKVIKVLGISEKEYRQTLSKVRAKLNVVETLMSSGKFTEIDYSKVPSRAMSIYRTAFFKHDESGMTDFVNKVQKGEAKVNAGTLYPYDLLNKMGLWIGSQSKLTNPEPILMEQWKALPSYIQGENNILIMADSSGSMEGRPIQTSIGLALYFAERNKGAFANKFMTFSQSPELVTLKGETLADKVSCIKSIVANTDLDKAMKLILDTCIENNVPASEMPIALVIISDMQFDAATNNNKTIYEKYAKKYEKAGYVIPNIVFWNVSGVCYESGYQTKENIKGVQIYSGSSTSVFSAVIQNIGKTPIQSMIDTLNSPIFDKVII